MVPERTQGPAAGIGELLLSHTLLLPQFLKLFSVTWHAESPRVSMSVVYHDYSKYTK